MDSTKLAAEASSSYNEFNEFRVKNWILNFTKDAPNGRVVGTLENTQMTQKLQSAIQNDILTRFHFEKVGAKVNHSSVQDNQFVLPNGTVVSIPDSYSSVDHFTNGNYSIQFIRQAFNYEDTYSLPLYNLYILLSSSSSPTTNKNNTTIATSASNSTVILISSHYDTARFSSGVMDNTLAVSMQLELLTNILNSNKVLRHSILFLWNNGEESGLLGSRAFMKPKQYDFTRSFGGNLTLLQENENKMFTTINQINQRTKRFINLDSAGGSGRSIMFRVSPSLLVNELKQMPYPHLNVIGEELFKAVPSDTDWTTMSTSLFGFDFAYYTDGYNYHTRADGIELIPEGSMYALGQNIHSLLSYWQQQKNLELTGDVDMSYVYFDVLGWLVITYPYWLTMTFQIVFIVANLLVIPVVCFMVDLTCVRCKRFNYRKLQQRLIMSAFAYVTYLLGYLVSFVLGIGLAVMLGWILTACQRSLSYHSHVTFLVFLYGFPAVTGMLIGQHVTYLIIQYVMKHCMQSCYMQCFIKRKFAQLNSDSEQLREEDEFMYGDKSTLTTCLGAEALKKIQREKEVNFLNDIHFSLEFSRERVLALNAFWSVFILLVTIWQLKSFYSVVTMLCFTSCLFVPAFFFELLYNSCQSTRYRRAPKQYMSNSNALSSLSLWNRFIMNRVALVETVKSTSAKVNQSQESTLELLHNDFQEGRVIQVEGEPLTDDTATSFMSTSTSAAPSKVQDTIYVITYELPNFLIQHLKVHYLLVLLLAMLLPAILHLDLFLNVVHVVVPTLARIGPSMAKYTEMIAASFVGLFCFILLSHLAAMYHYSVNFGKQLVFYAFGTLVVFVIALAMDPYDARHPKRIQMYQDVYNTCQFSMVNWNATVVQPVVVNNCTDQRYDIRMRSVDVLPIEHVIDGFEKMALRKVNYQRHPYDERFLVIVDEKHPKFTAPRVTLVVTEIGSQVELTVAIKLSQVNAESLVRLDASSFPFTSVSLSTDPQYSLIQFTNATENWYFAKRNVPHDSYLLTLTYDKLTAQQRQIVILVQEYHCDAAESPFLTELLNTLDDVAIDGGGYCDTMMNNFYLKIQV